MDRKLLRELPPTGGLPLRWRDLSLNTKPRLPPRLAQLLGVDDVELTCSGTAALIIALTTLARMSTRREVVVPAFTCPLVALAVAQSGLTLRLCDLQPDSFDMDPEQLARCCSEATLAIVPTHLAGRVADVGSAIKIAKRIGAYVIEDAAQAFAAKHANGTPVGLLGDIGFFSFAAGKGLTLFEGGALVARDPELQAQLRRTAAALIPNSPWWELRRCLELLGYAALYAPARLGLPYGVPMRRALRRGDIAAAVGDVFPTDIPLHRVGAWRQAVAARASLRLTSHLEQLRVQAQARLPLLRQIKGVRVLDDANNVMGTWPALLLLMPDRATRDAVMDRLWGAGVGVSRLFAAALPDYAYLRSVVPTGEVPRARDFASRSLTITNSVWLDDSTFRQIIDVIEAVCQDREA